ncbi:Hypothetical predicted protein [Mytilus galloprovincialis]|uniref:CCHC-type domain-containing protein n=1 Tax=Mytilus galloprovincialis TaxID=29158 RepID=A0A8B6C0R4_MYTGA|nr:Hypothetical predicted protein [Mytilus galloprovincialis]
MPPKGRSRRNRSEDDEIEIRTNLSTFKPSPTKDIVKPTIFYGNLDEDIDNRAAEFYESLEDDKKEDIATLCESLRTRFMPKELQSLYYSNLFQARQREGQNVEDFASEINKLATRAYSDMKRDQKDVLIKEHFIQGLKQDIKRFVMLSNPTTFEEAFRSAKREECNNTLTNRDKQTVAACAISNNNLEDNIKDLSEQMKVLAMQMNNIPTRGRGGFGNRGNRFQQSRGQGRGRGYGSNRNLRASDGRPICNYCMKVGHVERSCDEKNSTYASGN